MNQHRVMASSLLIPIMGLFLLNSAHAQTRVKSSERSSYQSIFRDFYDLATPHNRGEDFSFGVAAQFSTHFPMKRLGVVTGGTTYTASRANFFNYQAKFFARLWYFLELYLVSGYNEFYTDVPMTSQNYKHVSIQSFPVVLGAKYRMLKKDFVPYVFFAAGLYFSKIKVTEELLSTSDESKSKSLFGFQGGVGVEIFIESHFGFAFDVGFEHIKLGTVSLNDTTAQGKGPFVFKTSTQGITLASNFFYEF